MPTFIISICLSVYDPLPRIINAYTSWNVPPSIEDFSLCPPLHTHFVRGAGRGFYNFFWFLWYIYQTEWLHSVCYNSMAADIAPPLYVFNTNATDKVHWRYSWNIINFLIIPPSSGWNVLSRPSKDRLEIKAEPWLSKWRLVTDNNFIALTNIVDLAQGCVGDRRTRSLAKVGQENTEFSGDDDDEEAIWIQRCFVRFR